MLHVPTDDYDDDEIDNRTEEPRWSRNSTGNKESEFVGPRLLTVSLERENEHKLSFSQLLNAASSTDDSSTIKKKDDRMLAIVFCLMVVIGLGNKVFNKLQTIPMYNYANFLNLLTTFVYIPICFAYIIPMAWLGKIPREQLEMPRKPFIVMGTLDACAGIMQIFSATYLPGPLVILLSQAAIPVSMVISKYLLKAVYSRYQYAGAFIVALGILIVLAPTLSGNGSILWSVMMILSTVPMALSSVYKEIALGETEIDPMYLNGWVAVFQFLFALVLCIPASFASEPPVPLADLPSNLYDGLMCYFGKSTITCAGEDDNCVSDQCYLDAPVFVNIYIFFNQLYNLLIILMLKYGSANLLYLALTLMVPLGNVAFTIPIVPSSSPLKVTDIVGLIVICFGLGCYRFAATVVDQFLCKGRRRSSYQDEEKVVVFARQDNSTLVTNLLRKDANDESFIN